MFLYALLVSIRILNSYTLLFWELNNDNSWNWWRLYLPGAICVFLVLLFYWQVFYSFFMLFVAYLIMLLAFTGFIFVCWVWLCVDWSNCKSVLWCANVHYYSVDPVTKLIIHY